MIRKAIVAKVAPVYSLEEREELCLAFTEFMFSREGRIIDNAALNTEAFVELICELEKTKT